MLSSGGPGQRGPRPPHSSVGRTPLGEGSARHRDYLTSTASAGFKRQTLALDGSATVIGHKIRLYIENQERQGG